jgi:hypothetical protein
MCDALGDTRVEARNNARPRSDLMGVERRIQDLQRMTMSKTQQDTNETELSSEELSGVQGGLSIRMPPIDLPRVPKPEPRSPTPIFPVPRPFNDELLKKIREALDNAKA